MPEAALEVAPFGELVLGLRARSWTCTMRRSRTARPVTEPRVNGNRERGQAPADLAAITSWNGRAPAAPRSVGHRAGRCMTSVAPQKRAAARTTVSRTGWMSVGDPEIARRISAVAVCCSRVSVSSRLRASRSLTRRAFSMAISV